MILVELFDLASVENVSGFLLLEPRKVVFLGDPEKINVSLEAYSQIALKRGKNIEFVTQAIEKNNLNNIVQTMKNILEECFRDYPDEEVIIDLGGGEDLALVAAGIVYGMYKGKVQLQRFSISTGSMIDCDEGTVISDAFTDRFTVEEYIMINGGKVNCSVGLHESGNSRQIDKEFEKDILAMWKICKENPSAWNRNVNAIGNTSGGMVYVEKSFLRRMSAAGLIKNYKEKFGGRVSFDFKNNNVKRCLTKSGTLLELYVTLGALKMKDEKGEYVYNDVMTGVQIDWPRNVNDEIDVENEIDVILTRDLVPVFISCKNGTFTSEELYKFSVVAARFGGKYVKKVLVTPYINKKEASKDEILAMRPAQRKEYSKRRQLLARAEKMGIEIIGAEVLYV